MNVIFHSSPILLYISQLYGTYYLPVGLYRMYGYHILAGYYQNRITGIRYRMLSGWCKTTGSDSSVGLIWELSELIKPNNLE